MFPKILTEQLITINVDGSYEKNSYQYIKYNNQKIYKDSNGYFSYSNNKKQYLSDDGKVLGQGEITPLMYAKSMTGTDGNMYNDSALEYYYNAYQFSTWLSSNIGDVKQIHAVDNEGNQIIDFATNTGDQNIFSFSDNNNPLVSGSIFNENRISVIRKSIETNLASAIANYNAGSAGTYQFQMPKFTEEDWDKLLNNISVSVFMQGVPIKSKYYNNFISFSKCRNIKKGVYDNGRVVSAEELEIVLTDIDFKIILESYTGTYEILESYFSLYKYLPKKFIDFILEKYVVKTKLKNVEGSEVNYALAKNSFNSLYGMTVTNNIKDEAIFDSGEWRTRKLDNTEILIQLSNEKTKGFLSFSWRRMGNSIR